MGCCSKGDGESDSKCEQRTDEFQGPMNNRTCRDIPCLLLFILFLIGMICVAGLAIVKGNPYRLINGVDSWGNVCNRPNVPIPNVTASGYDRTGLSKRFYFNPFHFGNKIPGFATPEGMGDPTPDSLITCVSECPNETILTHIEFNKFAGDTGIRMCKPGTVSYEYDKKVCPVLPIFSNDDILNRCIPSTVVAAASKAATTTFSSFSQADIENEGMAQKMISDIQQTYIEIFILFGISLVLSLIVVFSLLYIAAFVIWSLVAAVALLSVGACGYCWYEWARLDMDLTKLLDATKEEQIPDTAKDKVDTWLSYSIISSVVAAVILLILLVMRNRIGLVVQMFIEAGKAIHQMYLLLFMPIFTLMILVVSIGALAIVAVFIETSGEPHATPTGTVEYRFPEMWNYLRWYHLFGILWISAFIIACQDIVVAGAVAQWFFTRDKKELKSPICASIGRLIRYHLGSVAFGSFIIALIRLARIILGYIQSRLRGKTSKAVDILLKVLQCCLWCFDRFMRYLNRNAYIEISIYGYSFCSAAKQAFFTLLSNILRVAAISSIGSFVLFLGKLCVVAVVLITGNELMKNNSEINFIWLPITLGCIIGFAMANCFLLIYEIAIDTIFLCFCEDLKMNDGDEKPYFMSKTLAEYLNVHKKKKRRKSKSASKKPKSEPKEKAEEK